MKIASEWKLLESIKRLIDEKGVRPDGRIIQSIGDDCAVLDIGSGRYGLFSTDISIESVHFKRELSSPEDIGFKAMMGNISDIAAMGGECRHALISCGIPADTGVEYIEALYNGMLDAAGMAKLAIIGGDISRSSQLVLNIAIYGEVESRWMVRRGGARPGDFIYCTGDTGGSLAGLEIVLGRDLKSREEFPSLVERHNRPVARFDMVSGIVHQMEPTAMIDVSDGILSDLPHICDESGCGFRIERERLRISGELEGYCRAKGVDPYEYALGSGEEYELLFTSPKDYGDTMQVIINNVPITRIGEITASGRFIRRNGSDHGVPVAGWDHFGRDT